MAFEICYFFHEKKKDGGGYNTEEKKELKKRIGTGVEEVALDQVANAIIRQLARRDIWVVDVEVHEFTKKKISYKESNDGSGIVLKNKKFSLDNNSTLSVQDISVDVDEEASPSGLVHVNRLPTNGAANINFAEQPVNQNRVQFWTKFEPHPHEQEAIKKGLKFTVGKKYPVHRVKESSTGARVFHVTNDLNKVVQVDDTYFVNAGQGLVGEFIDNTDTSDQEPKLSYWSQMKGGDQAPALRKAKEVDPRHQNIPLDNGSIPESYFKVPELRKK